MCDFKPGDEVVYVGSRGVEPMPFQIKQSRHELLTEGQTYTVHSVLHEERWGGVFGLHLMEVICPNRFGFDHRQFRKVQRRDLTAWLATENTIDNPNPRPVPQRVREDA